ncbi:protein-tyrosine phosphatase family protein [Dictyobacter formicarum]|uniref:Tyrosine specific protein phosphatases domain-containing protein n=1 Tax=Dictyobacter formicarum TaxID=2778368 RepID=A0ABQ3VMN4_9CHLR|nr:protein-tyrosine phosphatase family protein [Dictyobacter formicarum]GHO86356.1 hypothetical protein KSZ_43620 [Dictyobacter formicarum]
MQAQLYSIQGLSTGHISIAARPRGGDWLIDEIKNLREAGVDTLVSLLTEDEVNHFKLHEEAAYCREQDISYCTFPIEDRCVPPFSASTFAFLTELHMQFKQGKHIAVHCRQGLGRAVLIAASLLVLNGISPEQAFEQLSKARGYTVPETEEQRAWVITFAQQRQHLPIPL